MNTLRPLLLVCLGLLYCAMSLHAAPGSLDPTFGSGGKVLLDFNNGSDQCTTMAVQSDGRIILGGSTNAGNYDFALARLNADGTLDVTFGSGGKVVTDFGSNQEINTIRVTTENKILVAGYSSSSTDDFVLARYTADGVIDSGFGTNGRVVTPVGTNNDKAYGLLIQPDGKIVVIGYASVLSGDDFAVVRYGENGILDANFGNSGVVTTDFGTNYDQGYSVALQTDGRLIVAGKAGNSDFALARYNTDGSLDASFGSSGKVRTDVSMGTSDHAYGLTLYGDGRILAAGFSGNDFAMVRYNANGSLDTTFNGTGIVLTTISDDYDIGRSVIIQPDNKIVLAGYSKAGGYDDFALVRFNSDGTLDGVFNGNGKVTTSFGATYDSARCMTAQSDGRILVAGYSASGNGYDFAIARYLVAASAPVVSTGGATGRGESGVTLNGSVFPAGADSLFHFEFGLTTAYGSNTSAQLIASSGTVPVQVLVAGLLSGATYHYRLVATNSEGTTYGQDMMFTTLLPQRYERISAFSEPSGIMPLGGVIEASDGNLYGSTSEGGAHGRGTIYRLSPSGKLSTLHHFSGADGRFPRGSLLQASDGNIYGTTELGGVDDVGTIFRLSLSGELTTVFEFRSFNTGAWPRAGLAEANNGRLYGTTFLTSYQGGGFSASGCVFSFDLNGTFSRLIHSSGSGFLGVTFDDPFIQAFDGNLYTTSNSRLFRITTSGTPTVVLDFSGSAAGIGSSPDGNVAVSQDGYLYGIVGTTGSGTTGGIYATTLSGAGTRVATFTPAEGGPVSLVEDGNGGFLIATLSGGNFGRGTICRMLPDRSLVSLYHFPSSGGNPNKGLILASDGNLYGTEAPTGITDRLPANVGSVFKMTPAGVMATLVRFTGTNHRYDRATLIQAGDGTILGTGSGGGPQQEGNVFSVSPAGSLTSLASFDGATRGSDPGAALVKAADGNY